MNPSLFQVQTPDLAPLPPATPGLAPLAENTPPATTTAAPSEAQPAPDALANAIAQHEFEKSEEGQKMARILAVKSRSVQELINDKSFRPLDFFNQHRDGIGPSLLDKLAEVQAGQEALPLTGGDVVAAVKETPATLGHLASGAFKAVKSVHTTPFKAVARLVSGEPEKIPATGAELVSGVETMATGFAGLAKSGAEKLADIPRRLYNAPLGDSPYKRSQRAEGTPLPENPATLPKYRNSADRVRNLLEKAALVEQQGQVASGRGELSQSLGLDADTLAQKGITLDPEVIQGFSVITDPTLLLPALSGLRAVRVGTGFSVANSAGRTLATATTEAGAKTAQEVLEQAAQRLGNRVSQARSTVLSGVESGVANTSGKVARVVEAGARKAGAALEKSKNTTRGIAAGAALVSPEHIPAIIGGYLVKGVAKYGLGVLAEVASAAQSQTLKSVAGAAARTGVETVEGAAKGALHGAVYSAPFAAALEDPRDQAQMLATGAALGATVGGAAKSVASGFDAATRIAEIAAQEHLSPRGNVEPRNPTILNVEGMQDLEAGHAALREQVVQTNPQEAYRGDIQRAALNSKGLPAYYVTPEQFAALVPGGEGKLGVAETVVNGKPVQLWVVKDGVVEAQVHEPGHFWFDQATPEEQAALTDAFSPEQVQKYRESLVSTRNYTPEQAAQIDDAFAVREMAAEALGHVAEGDGLAGVDPTTREKIVGVVSKMTNRLIKPMVREGTGQAEGRFSRTGVEQTHNANAEARRILQRAMQDPEVQAALEADYSGNAVPAPVRPSAPAPTADPIRSAIDAYPAGSFERGAAETLATKAKNGTLNANDRSNWEQLFPGIEVPTTSATPVAPKAPVGEVEVRPVPATASASATPEIKPPSVRGVKEADYTPFVGKSREPAAGRIAEGAQKVATAKDISPTAKAANKVVFENTGKPVEIVYDSAAETGSKNAESYRLRRQEVEAARSNPDLRAAATKLGVIPLDFSNGAHIVWSGDAALVNIKRVLTDAHASGNERLVPYPMKDGKLVDGGAKLADDLINYTRNQNNGYRGDGGELKRPANPKGFIPDVNPDYTPVPLSESVANFANLLMGEQPPITARKPQAGTTPVPIRAKAIADVNQRKGTPTGPVYEAPLEIKGAKVYDFNPLRQEMQAAGMSLRDLNPVHERLAPSRIKSATPMADVGFQPTSGDVTAAGFMAEKLPANKVAEYEAMVSQLRALPLNDMFGPVGTALRQKIETFKNTELGGKAPEGASGVGAAGVAKPFMAERTKAPTKQLPGNDEVKDIAAGYAKSRGIDYKPATPLNLNPEVAKRIADFYESATSNPTDPAVQASYKALADETAAQYRAIVEQGYTLEPFTGKGEPYASSADMMTDVRDNKHLYFLPTEEAGTLAANNPMMADSGVNGWPVNDLFRAVHDFFGHSKDGNQFGPKGELNAWGAHSAMYSPEAQGALAAETLAQNSWVNFGKHLRDKKGNVAAKGESGYVPPTERPFAEQKNILIPQNLIDEAWGSVDSSPVKTQYIAPVKRLANAYGDTTSEYNRIVKEMGPANPLTPRMLEAYETPTKLGRISRDRSREQSRAVFGVEVVDRKTGVRRAEGFAELGEAERVLQEWLQEPSEGVREFMAAKTEAGKKLEAAGFELERVGFPGNRSINLKLAGRTVGQILTAADLENPKSVRIAGVDVLPSYRREGVAEALYREALTDLQADGVTEITGNVVHEGPLRIRSKLLPETEFADAADRPLSMEAAISRLPKQSDDGMWTPVGTIKAKSKIDPDIKFMAKKKEEPKRNPTAWILPDSTYHGLTKNLHEAELAANAAKWNEKFGTNFSASAVDEANRQPALNAGFVRVRATPNGDTTVELNAKFWGRQKEAVRQHLVAIKGRLNDVTVRLINDKGRMVSEASDNVYMSKDKEASIADVLKDIKAPAGAVAKEPTAIQRARAFQAGGGDRQFMAEVKDAPENLKEWAANTKVVGDSGQPLRVYHGTAAPEFNRFNIPSKGHNSNVFGSWEVERHAAFFTPDRASASEYGNARGYYLKLEDLADLTGPDFSEALYNSLVEKGVNSRWLDQMGTSWELFDGDDGKQFVAALKALGYDGAKLLETSPDTRTGFESFAVFDPESVRRAEFDFMASLKKDKVNPRAVKSAAIQLRDGEIFEDAWHGGAILKAVEAGRIPEEYNFSEFIEGFLTNEGEFLSREQAYDRAIEIKQMKPQDAADDGMAYDAVGRTGMLESQGFENVRQFMAAKKPLPEREPIVDQLELGKPVPPVDRYSRAYTNQLTKEQLREHWPEAILDKEGPISSDLVGSPVVRKNGLEKAAKIVGDKLVERYKQVADRPETKLGETWYSRFAPALREFFGNDTQLFAEFLAATSPNTNPQQNFRMATEAYRLYKAGWYKPLIAGFEEGLSKLADGSLIQDYKDAVPTSKRPQNISNATLMRWWIESQDLKPTKAPRLNGKTLDVEDQTLFGMSSAAVLKVAARRWMQENAGPKTAQFVQNLTGVDDGATIDVWADRTLRQAAYEGDKQRWRILPENSAPVNDADFAFGQSAFKHAADKLGIKPSALQGALWFAEKAAWAEKGWSPLNLGDFMPHLEELKAKAKKAEDLYTDVPETKEQALANVQIRRKEAVAAQKEADRAKKALEVEIRRAAKKQIDLF